MGRKFVIIFVVVCTSLTAGLLFASEGTNDGVVGKQDKPKGCVELAERLEIETRARSQFNCDISSYKEMAGGPRDKVSKASEGALR